MRWVVWATWGTWEVSSFKGGERLLAPGEKYPPFTANLHKLLLKKTLSLASAVDPRLNVVYITPGRV